MHALSDTSSTSEGKISSMHNMTWPPADCMTTFSFVNCKQQQNKFPVYTRSCTIRMCVSQWCSQGIFFEAEAGAEAELPRPRRGKTGAQAATPRLRQSIWRLKPEKQKHNENKKIDPTSRNLTWFLWHWIISWNYSSVTTVNVNACLWPQPWWSRQRPRRKLWRRAKAEPKIMSPSRGRGTWFEAEPRPRQAKNCLEDYITGVSWLILSNAV